MWPSKIKLLSVFNAFWRSEERKDWRNFVKVWFLFFIFLYILKFGFVNHLKSWTYISYHKNKFSNWSTKNFPKFFKISISSRFDRSSLFSDRSKWEEENSVSSLKSRVPSIPSQFLSINWAFFMNVLIPTQFLSINRISNF